jgi:tetratricopeptide (TPR) repeat protein
MVVRADYAGASVAAAEAANLAERENLLPLVAAARLTEAWIWNWSIGHGQDFEVLVERAIDATRHAGDISGEIEARHLGTNILFTRGRLDEFVDANRQLLQQAQSIGDDAHAAVLLERLQHVELMRGNLELSDQLAQADALATRLGLRDVALGLMRLRAHRLLFMGALDDALNSYQRLIDSAQESGAVQLEVAALRFSGMGLRVQGKYSEMALVLDRAIELSESTGERWNRAEVLALRARAAVELGESQAADRFIQRALEALRDEDVTGTSEVYDHLGVIRAADGREAEAELAFRRSVESVIDTQYKWPLVNALVDYAAFLVHRGRLAEASSVLERNAGGWGWLEGQVKQLRSLIKANSRGDT